MLIFNVFLTIKNASSPWKIYAVSYQIRSFPWTPCAQRRVRLKFLKMKHSQHPQAAQQQAIRKRCLYSAD